MNNLKLIGNRQLPKLHGHLRTETELKRMLDLHFKDFSSTPPYQLLGLTFKTIYNLVYFWVFFNLISIPIFI